MSKPVVASVGLLLALALALSATPVAQSAPALTPASSGVKLLSLFDIGAVSTSGNAVAGRIVGLSSTRIANDSLTVDLAHAYAPDQGTTHYCIKCIFLMNGS